MRTGTGEHGSERTYDVVVIGGGAAGLSGALTLARARRSVLVVDAGTPRNAPAAGIHNYLGREGSRPADLLTTGRAEVAGYGGEVLAGTVAALEPLDDVEPGGPRFRATLVAGGTALARRLLVATGVADELPDIPGLAERFGRDVLHCPYCHGWEVRDEPIGVLAVSALSVHQALMWRQWSNDVVYFRHVTPGLTDEQAEQFAARGIRVVDGEVAALEITADHLTGVRLRGGAVVARSALAIAAPVVARADALAGLGLHPVEECMGDVVLGSRVDANPTGATTVPGVWVAGNVRDVRAQVVVSSADGVMVAATINMDLIAEDTEVAVAAHRRERVFSPAAWDARHQARAAAGQDLAGPNPVLAEQIEGMKVGTALDAGAGTGADACWLAERGWTVTAVDLSPAALAMAADRAAGAGHTVTWIEADLSVQPAPATYDLVVSHHLCLPPGPRRTLFAHLAEAVAPGGTLLLVGHAPASDEPTRGEVTAGHAHQHGDHIHGHRDHYPAAPDPHLAEVAWRAQDVAEALGAGWTIELAETRPAPAHGGHHATRDSVLRARRDAGDGPV
jgi:thioredoxin reductase/SAM-dependent methyltransferase